MRNFPKKTYVDGKLQTVIFCSFSYLPIGARKIWGFTARVPSESNTFTPKVCTWLELGGGRGEVQTPPSSRYTYELVSEMSSLSTHHSFSKVDFPLYTIKLQKNASVFLNTPLYVFKIYLSCDHFLKRKIRY